MRKAAGGVVIDAHDRVLLRAPTGGYGGYAWTFAKGGVDEGETLPAAAIREVREETGWIGWIIDTIGEWPGDTTNTTYYLMRPVRQEGKHDAETEAIKWVSEEDAAALISKTTSMKGRKRDLEVLAKAFEMHRARTGGRTPADENDNLSNVDEDAFADALTNGKAVLIDNVWWQVARRSLDNDAVVLVTSKYALRDGYKPQKPKEMKFSQLVTNIKSGKWGARIGSKKYGPEQDKESRDKVRQKAGLSAAPGSGHLREDELTETTVPQYLAAYVRAEDYNDASQLESGHRMEYNVLHHWAYAQALWNEMSEEDQQEAFDAIEDGSYRKQIGAPDRYVNIVDIYNALDDGTDISLNQANEEDNGELSSKGRRLIKDAGGPDEKAEDGKAWIVLWADGRARAKFTSRPKMLTWAEKLGKMAEIVSVKYTDTESVDEAVKMRTHQFGNPAKLTKTRENALRDRGFTYRKNPNAPPAKKGYPPMVRAWARDEGIPLSTMQRMWDMSLDEVETNFEHPRPEPGDKRKNAVEFWKEVTRTFKSILNERHKIEK